MKKLIFFLAFCSFSLNVNAQGNRGVGIHHHNSYEIIHIIKKGETLSEIAEFYGTSSKEILKYNEGVIASKIKPNQVLIFPCHFDIHYIKDVLKLSKGSYRLLLRNEENGLYFDDKEARYDDSSNRTVGHQKEMIEGKVLTPKAKPVKRAAMTKEQYEAMQRNTASNTDKQPAVSKPVSTPATAKSNNPVPVATPVSTPQQQTYDPNAILHLVKTGETLYSLSKQYSVTVENLKAWNSISANNQLPLGENIVVGFKQPANQSAPTPAQVKPPKAEVSPDDVKFHVVKQGETLFKIAKKYNINIESLKKFNKLQNNGISVGQQILIPTTPNGGNSSIEMEQPANNYQPEQTQETFTASVGSDVEIILEEKPIVSALPAATFEKPTNSKAVYHTVEPKETLFRISKQYGMKVEDIRAMNNFSTDFTEISPGDVLVVGYAKLSDNSSFINMSGNKRTPISNPMTKFKRAYNIKKSHVDYEEIFETGKGTWDRMEGQDYLYVLHRKAPLNTVIQLTNPMNNATIFVKVIGKLEPRIGEEDVDIRLSTKAIEALRILDDQFRIKMKYHVRR